MKWTTMRDEPPSARVGKQTSLTAFPECGSYSASGRASGIPLSPETSWCRLFLCILGVCDAGITQLPIHWAVSGASMPPATPWRLPNPKCQLSGTTCTHPSPKPLTDLLLHSGFVLRFSSKFFPEELPLPCPEVGCVSFRTETDDSQRPLLCTSLWWSRGLLCKAASIWLRLVPGSKVGPERSLPSSLSCSTSTFLSLFSGGPGALT